MKITALDGSRAALSDRAYCQSHRSVTTVQWIAKAVAWVHAHFSEPINVEALAELVDLSLSSFHQHFKSVTSMSPLQYQKVLRLQEARRLDDVDDDGCGGGEPAGGVSERVAVHA